MGEKIDAVRQWKNDKIDYTLYQIRQKYHSRWMEVSGALTIDDIDYSNPFVKIEWLLCDPGWLHAIKSKRGREKFKDRLDDPLAWWIFCNYKDESDGSSYWDLTKNSLKHQISVKYKNIRTRRNGR